MELRDEKASYERYTERIERSLRAVAKAEKVLKEGSDSSYLQQRLGKESLTVLLARYSRGDAMADVVRGLRPALEHWAEGLDEGDGYSDTLRAASLAAMLGGEGACALAREAVERRAPRLSDWLMRLVLGSGEEPPAERPTLFRAYAPLAGVARAEPGERPGLMRAYLARWYQRQQGCWWWGLDRSSQPLFFGYWALEAGAVAMRLGMDDSALRGRRFYPYDMAHYLRDGGEPAWRLAHGGDARG